MNYKGAALCKLERYDESLEYLNQAVNLDPTKLDSAGFAIRFVCPSTNTYITTRGDNNNTPHTHNEQRQRQRQRQRQQQQQQLTPARWAQASKQESTKKQQRDVC